MNIDNFCRDMQAAFKTGLLNYKEYKSLLEIAGKAAAGSTLAALILRIKGRAVYV